MSKTRIIIAGCWGVTIALAAVCLLLPNITPAYLPALVFWPARFFIPFASIHFKRAFFIGLFTILGLVPAVAIAPEAAHQFLGQVGRAVILFMLLTLVWSDVLSFRRA